MEKIVFKDSNQFRNLIRFLKEFASETTVFISGNKLIFQSNDVFNKIFLKSILEIENTYLENKNISFNINILNLYKILLSSNRLSQISFTLNDNQIFFEFKNKNIIKKSVISINYKNIDIKDLYTDLKYTIEINTQELYDILKKCYNISNTVKINIIKDNINFISVGDFASIDIKKNIKFVEDVNLDLFFELDKLLFACKLNKISKNLQLNFEEEKPIQIKIFDNNIKIIILLTQKNIENH